MLKTKFLISLVLTITILVSQVGAVFAAPTLQGPAPITGTVQSITLETDINTGITTVVVNMLDENELSQMVRISLETAIALGPVTLNGDGNPLINNMALGQSIEIEPTTVIPDEEEKRHPVGSALATFFLGIADYDSIMDAHDKGIGFGVIAEALWLTRELHGDSSDFKALILVRQTADFDALGYDSIKNWAQLRKAILDGKKIGNLGTVMSNKDNGNESNQDKNKDKNKDKNNNGNGNGNGNGNNK